MQIIMLMERNPESYTDTLNEMVKAFEKRNRMNDLSKILEEIDKIEDDAEFCEAEHDAVRDYCQSREFKLTDEEISEIESRGLYDSFLYWKDTYSEGMED